jgi:geranylgeranyl reductase family protein
MAVTVSDCRPAAAWDVIVVGAGPAGAATAAHLARAGRSVLLVDKCSFPRDKPCAEYASPETESLLRRLGAWPAIEAAGVHRLEGMAITSPSGERFLSHYLDGGQRRHALALPRKVLDDLLLRHAQSAGVDYRLGVRVERPIFEHGRVVGVRARRSGQTTEEPRASLVVAADGLHSALSPVLGGATPSAWPRRFGVATHYRKLDGPANWGEMYVGRSGYCGLAPLGNGTTTVAAALTMGPTPPDTARSAGVRSRLAVALVDHPRLIARLEAADQLKPFRGVAPLAWQARRTAGPGFLLVGDAAGFFDPFTGEGIFRALRGAELASEAALRVLRDGDWAAFVRRYGEMRQATFAAKERLARLIQVFVQYPVLLNYAMRRLQRRSELAERLSAALGDFGPPGAPLQAAYLARLLRP